MAGVGGVSALRTDFAGSCQPGAAVGAVSFAQGFTAFGTETAAFFIDCPAMAAFQGMAFLCFHLLPVLLLFLLPVLLLVVSVVVWIHGGVFMGVFFSVE